MFVVALREAVEAVNSLWSGLLFTWWGILHICTTLMKIQGEVEKYWNISVTYRGSKPNAYVLFLLFVSRLTLLYFLMWNHVFNFLMNRFFVFFYNDNSTWYPESILNICMTKILIKILHFLTKGVCFHIRIYMFPFFINFREVDIWVTLYLDLKCNLLYSFNLRLFNLISDVNITSIIIKRIKWVYSPFLVSKLSAMV